MTTWSPAPDRLRQAIEFALDMGTRGAVDLAARPFRQGHDVLGREVVTLDQESAHQHHVVAGSHQPLLSRQARVAGTAHQEGVTAGFGSIRLLGDALAIDAYDEHQPDHDERREPHSGSP